MRCFNAFVGATLVTLGLFGGSIPRVFAQSYPSKPIRVVVAYAPGGSSSTGLALRLPESELLKGLAALNPLLRIVPVGPASDHLIT